MLISEDPAKLAGKAALARWLVLASLALLLLELCVTNYLSAVILLPFAYGVAKRDWRTHIWLCFVLLFYFLVNINHLADKAGWLDYLETALIVTLFIAAMLYCRWSRNTRVFTDPPLP